VSRTRATGCCGVCLGMLLGTMQEDGPAAAMIVLPTVKTRATDFSIAAIMARGPRGERRATCGAAAAAAAPRHSVGLPTMGKFRPLSAATSREGRCSPVTAKWCQKVETTKPYAASVLTVLS